MRERSTFQSTSAAEALQETLGIVVPNPPQKIPLHGKNLWRIITSSGLPHTIRLIRNNATYEAGSNTFFTKHPENLPLDVHEYIHSYIEYTSTPLRLVNDSWNIFLNYPHLTNPDAVEQYLCSRCIDEGIACWCQIAVAEVFDIPVKTTSFDLDYVEYQQMIQKFSAIKTQIVKIKTTKVRNYQKKISKITDHMNRHYYRFGFALIDRMARELLPKQGNASHMLNTILNNPPLTFNAMEYPEKYALFLSNNNS